MKKILVAPLNWGLGHATRCIPVINELLNQSAKVIIAGDGESLKLLQHEFPQLNFFELPSYNISYGSGDSMLFKMLSNYPKIRKAIAAEHEALKLIQHQNNFDAIISDNRYGMWHEETQNIFITHQINIQVPKHLKWLQPLLLNYNLKQISNFNECWIPDFKDHENLSGDLSHNCKLPDNSYYIGPLSRFFKRQVASGKEQLNDNGLKTITPVLEPNEANLKLPLAPCLLLIILSGPEPQRSIFEKIILDQLKNISLQTLIVRGLTEKYEVKQLKENAWTVSYLTSETLLQKIKDAKIIVSRSGYSTIMDLTSCGKHAILVPTPGQTEQEYLAHNFHNKNIFYSCNQQHFFLEDALHKVAAFKGMQINNDGSLLKERISSLIKQ